MRYTFLSKPIYQHLASLVIILFVTIPIIVPFLKPGFFPTHDGEWTVVRLSEMYREIKDGQFPPRYSTYLNFGHGYPLFNFAYPLPYYLGMVPVFLKFGFVNSIKLIFVISIIASGVFMYLAASKLWNNKTAGIVTAILWLYLPYRMVDLYVRGSLGESVAFIFFPVLIWLALKVRENSKSGIYQFLSVLSIAALILSHNIMALLFLPIYFVLISILALVDKNKAGIVFFRIVVLGVGTAAFFWLPALAEKNNILLSHIPIADRNLYYISLKQFLIPSWGYGVPGATDAFTYQLGLPQIMIFIVSVVTALLWFLRSRKKFTLQQMIFTASVLMLSIQFLLLFSFSSVLWEHIPLLSEINYPWTLIGPMGFLVSLISGYFVTRSASAKVACLFLAVLAIVLIIPYAKPKEYVDRGEGFYTTNDATTTSSKEYTPLWVKEMPVARPENYTEIIKGMGEISDTEIQSNKIDFSATVSGPSTIRIKNIYYPGWKAFINGQETQINYDNPGGLMQIQVLKGQNNISLLFTETPLRLVADTVSIISLLAAFVLCFIPLRVPIKK